jgi:chromosome segregation ATPase
LFNLEHKLQFVVITHKRSLFLEGESLVGLTKFKDNPFSKAFSLRLNDPDDELDLTRD